MSKVTAIIKTIGRSTLQNAIDSVDREGFPAVIVSDGYPLSVDINKERHVYCELKKNWGCYGAVAANVGLAFSNTEYVVFVDDDDEFIHGAGDVIRNAIKRDPLVDIWIQGIFICETGQALCFRTDQNKLYSQKSGHSPVKGTVAVPVYRADILAKNPFSTDVHGEEMKYADYHHVASCVSKGANLDWLGEITYLVRPSLAGSHEEGKL